MTSLVPLGNKNILLQDEIDHIKLDEVQALLRACDIAYERSIQSDNYRWIRDRDKLLFTVMWSTGARITDVLSMSSYGISFRDASIHFLVKKRKVYKKVKKGMPKGEPEPYWNTITLDQKTLGEIADYCNEWEIKGLLFPHTRGSNKPIVRQSVNQAIKKYCGLVGIRQLHPHMFRHGIAMHMQGKGVPVEVIAHHLGHADTKTTLEFYARLSASQERMILESLNVDFWK